MRNLTDGKMKKMLGLEIQADIPHILSKQPMIEANHLRVTSQWLFGESAKIFNGNVKIAECAWTYLTVYLLSKEINALSELELISWTCLSIASRKFSQSIPLVWILQCIDFRADRNELLRTHLDVYEIVKNHELCLVSDVIDCLGELIPHSDIQKIKEKALVFSVDCYKDFKVTSYLRVGLAAIFWALDQLQLQFLLSTFEEVDEIRGELEQARQIIGI